MSPDSEPRALIGQRLWVAAIGQEGICLDVVGTWILVQDRNGRRHAALLQDVELSSPSLPYAFQR